MSRTWVSFGVVVALLAVAPVRADAASTSPDGRHVVAVKHSLLGVHTWYEQTFRGLPVLDGFVAEHRDHSGGTRIDDGRLPVTGVPSSARVSADAARSRAQGTPESVRLSVKAPSRLVWSVVSAVHGGRARSLIDAVSGDLVEVRRLGSSFDGEGRVFEPNPVVTLRD